MTFIQSNFAIFLAIFLYALIHFFNRFLHNNIRWFILGSLLLSIISYAIDIPFLSRFIDSGQLSLALFILVMLTGILKKKSIYYKRLLLFRGDLAILGFIYLLPHGFNRLSLALNGYNTSGLFAMIILLPLTITSFMTIRKKIRPDRWKKLHLLAYVAYLFIYMHIGFTAFITQDFYSVSINEDRILFHLLFVVYFIIKIVQVYQKKILKK